MKRFLLAGLLFLACLAAALGGMAQEDRAAPTLVAPTLVPISVPATPATSEVSTTSAVAQIAQTGELRAGVLFNDAPYSELSLQGEIRGFDVAVLRLLAETWEVDLQLVQVTRQNAIEQLESGAVQVVASALLHYRELDSQVEFSQAYLAGRQALMTRADSAYATPMDLIDKPLGFVLGTRAETALIHWSERRSERPSERPDAALDRRPYLTLDQALAALSRGDVEAIIGEEQALLAVSRPYAAEFRMLEAPVLHEPRALAVKTHEASLRNLLNRSLQYLFAEGDLEDLFRQYFPSQDYPEDLARIWENADERPQPGQFPAQITYPERDALSQALQGGLLRIGGLTDGALPGAQAQADLARLNRELVEEMARRWGLGLEWRDVETETAFALLREGELDLLVGVMPDWRWANEADFAAPYLLHGDRLMAPINAGITGFNDLRGQWIGVMLGDEAGRARAQAWADSINASVQFYQTRPADAALNILEYDNADAIYANSLALMPHLAAHANALALTERWYSRSYYAFAVRQNDRDLRLLVEYTVQELMLDGSLRRLSAPFLLGDESLAYFLVPGAPTFAGINLTGA